MHDGVHNANTIPKNHSAFFLDDTKEHVKSILTMIQGMHRDLEGNEVGNVWVIFH